MGLRIFHILSLLLLYTVYSTALYAQSSEKQLYSFEFRGTELPYVLDFVARETNTDLVYDPQLVHGYTVYQRIREQEMPALLTSILKEFQLDYVILSTGTVVIVSSVSEAPVFGDYSGKIVDALTGEPLPGATILLADASSGTSTSAAGYFSLPKIKSGNHTIVFSYVGYKPVSLTVNIPPGEQIRQRIELHPNQVAFSPLVVESHRSQWALHTGSVQGEKSQADVMTNQAIRNLSLLPGIQHGLPMTDLHIQGGQENEHRILLDGIPVYNPYSIGQLFSSFSPYAVGRVELHKAGFSASKGSQIAGLIDLNHNVNHSENGGVLQVDPLSLNIRGDLTIPVHNQQEVHTMAAIRSSLWNLHPAPALQDMLNEWNRIDPLISGVLLDDDTETTLYSPVYKNNHISFFDAHLAAVYEPNNLSSFNGSFYFGDNSIQTELLNQVQPGLNLPLFLFASDSHKWTNTLAQLSWDKLVSPRTDLSIQSGYSENRFQHQNSLGTANESPFEGFTLAEPEVEIPPIDGRELPLQIDGNRISHFLSRADAAYSITPSLKTKTGIQFDLISSEIKLSKGAYAGMNSNQSASIISGYLLGEQVIGRFWRFEYGSRLTWLSSTKTVFAEPRFSIRYDQSNTEIGYWSIRMAGGLYRQFVNEFNVSNTGATSIVPNFSIWSHTNSQKVPKSYHATGSFLLEPTPSTSFSLEVFYKWQPNTNITSYFNLNNEREISPGGVRAFAESTQMSTAGFGVRFNHKLSDAGIRLMSGYDYSYSKVNLQSQFGLSIMPPWNEPHRAHLRAFVPLSDNLSIVSKWQGIWGRSWAFQESYYNFLLFNNLEQFGGFLFVVPEDDRLSAFQQVDLSVIFQPSIGNSDLEFRLDLVNILNRNNMIDQHLNPESTFGGETEFSVRKRTLPGFYPSLSVSISF